MDVVVAIVTVKVVGAMAAMHFIVAAATAQVVVITTSAHAVIARVANVADTPGSAWVVVTQQEFDIGFEHCAVG